MSWFFYILVFIISCLLLFRSGKLLIGGLMRIARFLKWREFVVAFFTIALAATLPNLFVGIMSVIHGIPQLSFGDVIGGNVVDLTIVVALAVLIGGNLQAKSRMVQTSSVFTVIIAILPILLLADKKLGRGDGIILLLFFVSYVAWLFSKKERFTKVYNSYPHSFIKGLKGFIKDLGKVILGIVFLLLAGEGIVRSALFFAKNLDLPLTLIGILIVGLGNAFPETYFAVVSAKRGQNWMVLGDLMGSVIMAPTLVLGVVSLLSPIVINDLSSFTVARLFLIISAVFFLFFVRTDRKITKKEAVFLLFLYLLFVGVEIFLK